MNVNTNIYMNIRKMAGMLFAGLLFFTSCTETDFDAISADKLKGDSLVTTYTIAQLKAEFMTNNDAYSDTVNYLGGLYTADLINSANDVVISGYVTSTDVEGNFYKNFVIQESGTNGQALKISIDASGLTALYPLGQKVWIRCNGLYIGKYGETPQLGVKYVNTERVKIKKSTGDTIYRIEPGRMPLVIAKKHIHTYGSPKANAIVPDTLTIAQLKAKDYKTLVNKIVCIKNAYFTGKSEGDFLADRDLYFAPSYTEATYPILRDIADATGTISIASSIYAKFADYKLPASTYRGNITVIVGWYRNYTNDSGTWQLSLRTLNDLGKGFENYIVSVK
ncbi:MAG: hypothetical protein H6Q20_851 [Bacteroidetes bacterium]|nr:hypothetical protein [Bacteroidota bacterium]